VATVSRAHGVNANLVFHWRKLYHAGLLDRAPDIAATNDVRLLPVVIQDERAHEEEAATPTDSNGNFLSLRPLHPSDRRVSARDILKANPRMRWKELANPDAFAALTNGTVAYTAQLSLAASYGYLQLTYFAALGTNEYGGDWKGSFAPCNGTQQKDPDNLFDTTCNLNGGGGSLRMGTRITAKHFAGKYVAKSTNPSVPDGSTLEGLFSQAYQLYNSGKAGYGANVIATSKTVEPNPTGTIFTTGGQQ
jgi:hypothetical protein